MEIWPHHKITGGHFNKWQNSFIYEQLQLNENIL